MRNKLMIIDVHETNRDLDLRHWFEFYAPQQQHYQNSRLRSGTVFYHSMVWVTAMVAGYFFYEMTKGYFNEENSSAHDYFPEKSFAFWKYTCATFSCLSNAFLATYCLEDLFSDLMGSPIAASLCGRRSDLSHQSAEMKIKTHMDSLRAAFFNFIGKAIVIVLTIASFIMFFMNMLSGKDSPTKLTFEIISSLTNMAMFYFTFKGPRALASYFDVLRYLYTPEYHTRKVARALSSITLAELEICEDRGIEECKIRQSLLTICTLQADDTQNSKLITDLINHPGVIRLGLQLKLRTLAEIMNDQCTFPTASQKYNTFKSLQHEIGFTILYSLAKPLTTPMMPVVSESTSLLAVPPKKSKLQMGVVFSLMILSSLLFQYYRWMTCILSGLGYVTNSSEAFQNFINRYSPENTSAYWLSFVPAMISNINLCWESSLTTYNLIKSLCLYLADGLLRLTSTALNHSLSKLINIQLDLHLPYYTPTLHKSLDYHLSLRTHRIALPGGTTFEIKIPWIWFLSNFVILLTASLAWPANVNVNEKSVLPFFYNKLKKDPSAFWENLYQQITINAIPGSIFVNYYFGILYLLKRSMDFSFFCSRNDEELNDLRSLRITFQKLHDHLDLLGSSSPHYFIEHIKSVDPEVLRRAIIEKKIELNDLTAMDYDIHLLGDLTIEKSVTTVFKEKLGTMFGCFFKTSNRNYLPLSSYDSVDSHHSVQQYHVLNIN